MHLRLGKVIFIFSLLIINIRAKEKFLCTSIVGLEQLLETERGLIENLNNYALELQKKLETVRSAVVSMRILNEKFLSNPEEYLSNPLNSFSLIRRLKEDWINWEMYMTEPLGTGKIEEIKKQRIALPSSNDLVEAVKAIHRIQNTYDLRPEDIATGLLNGRQYDIKLSPKDCYAIGNELFNKGEFYDAGSWLYTALQSFQYSEVSGQTPTIQQILDLYAETMLKEDKPKEALKLINESLKISPFSVFLLRRKAEVEKIIKTGNLTPRTYLTPEPTSYQRGCRGEYSQQPSKLHCRYNTTTTAFLKLAPLKMEEIHLEPYMVIYHDVISEREIAELKLLAIPNLKRATVYSETAADLNIVVDQRTSKMHWLPDDTSDTTLRIRRRIADMTGFDLYGSEMFHIINYGLGGHYTPHYDFFNASETAHVMRMFGDRVATVLFYLSDVEQGGDTVFPNIKIAIHPRKGSAVLWYNLNNKGEGDWKTMHAACPVVVGSKWVCNKWIPQNPQIFRRPCYKQ